MKKWVYVVALASILVARALLTNINSAEWGDSYRILRASNFIRQFSYPSDEKRPPLFSILLAIRPTNIDAVLWGRIFILAISFASMFVFYKLSQKLLSTKNQRMLALVFLFLNPVYLYWSLRIYADVPFSLLVMLCFYVFELWREKLSNKDKLSMLYPTVMGLICGLGILTRFEGYLLTFAALVGVIIIARERSGRSNPTRTVLPFLFAAAIVVLPWLIYRNPLTSSYFEETTGRIYDFETFLTYLVSYIFVLGIIPAGSAIAAYFFKKSSISLPGVLKKYPHIAAFVLLESLLILAWPAAVPRLFVPIIPFLVIAFVSLWRDDREGSTAIRGAGGDIRDPRRECCDTRTVQMTGVVAIILTAIYIIAQNHLRLQFLGSNTTVFLFISAVSVICTLLIILKRCQLFIFLAIISMVTLSASVIYLHKDTYRSIKDISIFSLREARGKIIHNDTSGVVNWYFPESKYKNFYDEKKYLTQEYLTENNVDYIILTNETNLNMEIDLEKRPYLSLVKESKYQRGGKIFFTWLVKVQR